MKLEVTQRGFAYYDFTDVGQRKCNIQKSSSGMESCIWLGSEEIGIKGFKPYKGWRDISDQEIKIQFDCQDIIANNRMHLNREQVKALIPILQKFVDTGDID